MKWLNKLTLQKRISLIVLIILVVGLSLFSWVGIQAVNDSLQRTLEERLIIARLVASQMDENMTHILMHLQKSANFNGAPPSKEQFETVANSLSEILAESKILARDTILIGLIGKDGKVTQVEPADSDIVGIDMSGYPTVEKTLRTGLPFISDLVFNPSTGTPLVIMSAPVWDEKGEVIGVLIAMVDIEQAGISASSRSVILGRTGYTEVVDGNGMVLARSIPASPPGITERSDHPGRFAELIRQGKTTIGTCHRCHETKETLERKRDVLAFAPLATTTWGVAVRQPEEEALAPTSQLRQRLFSLGILIILIAFFLVWTMIQGFVKPIKTLTDSIKRVAAGDFRTAVPVKRQDEIGQLNSSFHSMTQELAKSRQELIKSRDELVVRNQELSALNSIAGTVNQSLNLADVLENTIQKVMEVTGTTTSCVFLRDADTNRLERMSSIGSSNLFKCHQATSPAANCACHQVLRYGQTLMVNDTTQCPRLTEEVVTKEDISSFVSIPLKSKDKTLGIMNIACSDKRCFTENDFSILDSIAYHVGLAIENSVLYEEAKQKEELRGRLLSSVMNAQEEERKRIARELHDDYGQTLTVLRINLESLETMTTSEQLKEKLRQSGALLTSALEDLRRLTLDLRPQALDQLGLIAAIRSYVQTHLEPKGIQVEFQTKGASQRLAPEVETALFRITEEAIHNIIKHAEAHNVRIQLEVNDGKITAVIQDDGKGFDMEAVFSSKVEAQSLGIQDIQERAALLGGTLNITSLPGQGTQLVIEIPTTGSLRKANRAKTR